MKTYSIADYGAVGDGVTVCTEEIQCAIDACGKGGMVYVPAGTYRSGALWLKSDMTLYVEKGARLLGSDDPGDFPVYTYPFEGEPQPCYASLINIDGAPHRNITIDGEGIIDANGRILFEQQLRENKGKRGRAICLRNTANVTIRNITVRQSPAWCLHLIYCEGVVIDNVKVHTKYDEDGNKYDIFNGDGIDIDSCRNVRISGCMIASQDDCIAIKSGKDVIGRRVGIPSENVTIESCSFKSGFGVAIGSEMSGGVKDVYVRNCTFTDTHSIATLKAIRGRGGYIKNIHYENCTLDNTSTEHEDCEWFRGAIYLDGFYSHREFDPEEKEEINGGTPEVDGIYFSNIDLRTVAGRAIYLCGLPEAPYKNVYLMNVRAHGVTGLYHNNIDNLQLIDVYITSEK